MSIFSKYMFVRNSVQCNFCYEWNFRLLFGRAIRSGGARVFATRGKRFVAAPTPACRSGETRNLPGDQWNHCHPNDPTYCYLISRLLKPAIGLLTNPLNPSCSVKANSPEEAKFQNSIFLPLQMPTPGQCRPGGCPLPAATGLKRRKTADFRLK